MTFMDHPHHPLSGRHDSGTTRYLTIADIVLIAGLTAGGYLASTYLGSGQQSAAGAQEKPVRQSVCSDEELRHMRANIDACYDVKNLPGKKSDLTASPGTLRNT